MIGIRWAAPVLGVLAAAVLAVTGCSSAVTGTGTAVTPSPTSSSAASSGSSTTPTSVYRTPPAKDPFGDPVTTDFCYGITLSAFDKWGQPFVHPYQLADACFIDVVSGTDDLLLDIISHPSLPLFDPLEPDSTMTTATTIKKLRGGYTEGIWDDDGGVCERAFGAPDVAIAITEEQLSGTSTASERCGVAQAALTQVAANDRQTLPRRSLANPTITRFDLCGLLDKGGLTMLPGFGDAVAEPDLGGAECGVDTYNYGIQVRFAFESVDEPPLHEITYQGHTLQLDGSDTSCDAVSTQGVTSDGSDYEILDMIVYPETDSGTGAQTAMCDIAEGALVDMLTAAHLH